MKGKPNHLRAGLFTINESLQIYFGSLGYLPLYYSAALLAIISQQIHLLHGLTPFIMPQ